MYNDICGGKPEPVNSTLSNFEILMFKISTSVFVYSQYKVLSGGTVVPPAKYKKNEKIRNKSQM